MTREDLWEAISRRHGVEVTFTNCHEITYNYDDIIREGKFFLPVVENICKHSD